MPFIFSMSGSITLNGKSNSVSSAQTVQNNNSTEVVTALENLQTNIGKAIGSNFFKRALNYVFHHNRTVELKKLNENLSKNGVNPVNPEEVLLSKYIPEKIKDLYRSYLDLCPLYSTPGKIESPEEVKTSLTQEEFNKIWHEKKRVPLGSGGFGTVYGSGKYALKVPNEGNSLEEDKEKNQALKENFESFDLSQIYYKENSAFITKYVGTFQLKDGTEVAVFERIKGKDFSEYNAKKAFMQCRLLAQAATALAISHEAGCINSDVKPQNMMVSGDKKFPVLKLIDQGGVIDLTKGETGVHTYTPTFAAPEFTREKVSPAIDVFSLGVTIFEKMFSYKNKKLVKNIENKFQNEALRCGDIGARESFLKSIDEKIKIIDRGAGQAQSDKLKSVKFLYQLLQDCLARKPENRISAAQLAEILQVFSTYLENPSSGCPKYEDVKNMAIEDCPKGIPIALRKMLFNPDQETQNKGIEIIKNLATADPSYESTPSYGMILALKDPNGFRDWAKRNTSVLKELQDRIYVSGSEHKTEQDMPVSQEIYETIHNYDPEKPNLVEPNPALAQQSDRGDMEEALGPVPDFKAPKPPEEDVDLEESLGPVPDFKAPEPPEDTPGKLPETAESVKAKINKALEELWDFSGKGDIFRDKQHDFNLMLEDSFKKGYITPEEYSAFHLRSTWAE